MPDGGIRLMVRWAILLVGVAILALPLAAGAQSRTVEVASAEPVLLAGDLRARFDGGGLHVSATALTGAMRAVNATGSVRVQTWSVAAFSTTPGSPATDVRSNVPLERPSVESFELSAGTLDLQVRSETFTARATLGQGATLSILGQADASALPHWLAQPLETRKGTTGLEPEDVGWRFEAGWPFIGDLDYYGARVVGAPAPAEPLASVRGPVKFIALGGNVTFTDADGRTHAFRLGNFSEDDAPTAPVGPQAKVQTYRRLIFEGSVGEAIFPLAESWGASGPRVVWELDGRVRWTGAAASVEGGERDVRDAIVEGRGRILIEPRSPADAIAGEHAYRASGAWDALSLGGRTAVAPATPSALPWVGVSILAALAALLFEGPREGAWRMFAWLYTRLVPSQLLAHPQRSSILGVVSTRPGIHLKELHRHVGGGWGTFRFHVRMLRAAGYLILERRGRYLFVRTPGSSSAPAIGNPAAQRILAALPASGEWMSARELAEGAGVSRQLLNYHLRQLARLDLLVESHDEAGMRRVARKTPGASAGAGKNPIPP